MRPSSLVGRMRAALREGDLCGAQEAFAKAVQRTSCSRTVKEATAALPVLLRTARETKDAELEERARRALDEASSGASADLRRRRRRREWRRDYFRRQAAASSGGPSREFMEAVLAASVDDDDAGSLEATLARFTGTHALGEALRRSPDRTLQCLNAALHRSRSSSSSRRVLRIMRSWGICPDAYTINAILHHKTTRSCNGSDEDLSKVVRQLWLAGNPPDKYTVSLLCSSLYEWNVDALDALGLIRCFMKFGVQVEASAYEKVLRLCSKQGEEELRRRVLEEMRLIFDREGDLGVGGRERRRGRRSEGLSGEKGPAETCEWAAYGGHLDVLKWARSQDLPPPCGSDPDSCIESSEENGNDDIADADWIEANRGSDEEEEGFGSSSDNKPTNLRKKATKAMLNKVPFL